MANPARAITRAWRMLELRVPERCGRTTAAKRRDYPCPGARRSTNAAGHGSRARRGSPPGPAACDPRRMLNPLEKAHYLGSAHTPAQLPPDGGLEVAFAGRSNAGKSSALNALTRQNALA